MKIIDLLNKIANGEEVPKKIRINGYIYEYQGDDYLFIDKNNDNHEYWLFSEGYTDKFQWLDNFIRTKIEIIEEEKKIPEKLDIRQEKNIKNNWKWKVYGKEHSYNISTPQKIIADKVNEICDYLKSKGDE